MFWRFKATRIVKIYLKQHLAGMNLRKNDGFLTPIPCISIREYGQSNTPLISLINKYAKGEKCTEMRAARVAVRSLFFH